MKGDKVVESVKVIRYFCLFLLAGRYMNLDFT